MRGAAPVSTNSLTGGVSYMQAITQTDYLAGGYQYKDGALEFTPHAEGFVRWVAGYPLYHFNYTDHLGNVRVTYADDGSGTPYIVEESNYYPFGLQHKGYNEPQLFEKNWGNVLTYVSVLNHKYKYNGKELQDELGLNMYDYGARNYDAAIGRWMNIDPLAEMRYGLSVYNYVQNNPMLRFDPNGLTDFILNRKTGVVTQVGDENDEPDRILKTNRQGKIKYEKRGKDKGKPKVAIGDIKQGILKDGMNLKTNDNLIAVGGKNQPTESDVESFALKLSNYIGKEIGGSYLSKDGADQTTHMGIGRYEGNSLTESLSKGERAVRSVTSTIEEFNSYALKGYFHTHPSGTNAGRNESLRFEPSEADLIARDKALKINPNLYFFLITNPSNYQEKSHEKIPYKEAKYD